MVKQNILVVVALAGLGFASGCENDRVEQSTGVQSSDAGLGANAIFDEASGLKVEPQNLPMISGGHYQAFVVTEGEETSVGRFNIGEDGMMYQVDEAGERMENAASDVSAQGAPQEQEQEQEQEKQREEEQERPEDGSTETPDEEATETPEPQPAPEQFFVTVESNSSGEGDAERAVLVSGEFVDGVAEAMMSSEEALTTDFAGATGRFVLGPQQLEATDTNQGVWFINPEDQTPALDLPELPSGWVYEAWVENLETNELTSLGQFSAGDQASAESDGVDAEGGEAESQLQVPGADFESLESNFSDGNHRVLITIQPALGGFDEPFSVEILSAEIPQDVERGEVIELNQEALERPMVRAEYMAPDQQDEPTDEESGEGPSEGEEMPPGEVENAG